MDMPVEKKIVFELNGRSVEAIEGETILEAAAVSYTHLTLPTTPYV